MSIECLGYVVVQTEKPDEWNDYLCNVVGAMRAEAPDAAAVHYRIDDRPFRFRIVEGEGERLVASGYRIDSRESLDALAEKLTAAGHVTSWGDDAEAELRGVSAYFSVIDPGENGLEFYCGDSVAETAFVSPIGVEGFVTGELGMGHAVFPAPDFEASYTFYNDLIGFHATDLPRFRVLDTSEDPGIPFAFLHADNGRHHSIAFGQVWSMPVGCIHLMLEMTSLENVKDCYARMQKSGVEESASIGKHSNDKVTSFYMKTPSGFDLEIGCGGLVIDPENWKPTAHHTPSEWGHEWAWQKAMAENTD